MKYKKIINKGSTLYVTSWNGSIKQDKILDKTFNTKEEAFITTSEKNIYIGEIK